MNETAISESKTNQDTLSLFDVGCLVNLKIGYWAARRMVTRNDLISVGYDPDKLPSEIVNLGRKLLVPKSEIQVLNQIEQKARKSLERWSVPFGIANSHFIPLKILPTVEQQIKELKTEFFERVDSFIVRFDDLVKDIRGAHPDFWEKCLKGHYPPNPKALRSRYQFKFYTFKIAGMNALRGVVADQKIKDERSQELHRQMQDEVGEFVGEYVKSMRDETIRFCELMTARVTGQPFGDETDAKKLTPKSISCFRNYVDRFRQMDIFDDIEIEKMLREFRDTFLDSGVRPRDFESNTVQSSITKALETIREKAAVEGESGSKFIGELRRKIVL